MPPHSFQWPWCWWTPAWEVLLSSREIVMLLCCWWKWRDRNLWDVGENFNELGAPKFCPFISPCARPLWSWKWQGKTFSKPSAGTERHKQVCKLWYVAFLTPKLLWLFFVFIHSSDRYLWSTNSEPRCVCIRYWEESSEWGNMKFLWRKVNRQPVHKVCVLGS